MTDVLDHTMTTTSTDDERRDALAERLFYSYIVGSELLTIELGRRLGLYDLIYRAGNVDSSELAGLAGIDERSHLCQRPFLIGEFGVGSAPPQFGCRVKQPNDLGRRVIEASGRSLRQLDELAGVGIQLFQLQQVSRWSGDQSTIQTGAAQPHP